MKTLTLAIAALALTVPVANADTLDGTYRCTIGGLTLHLGDIEIDGDTYRGPAYDGNYEGAHPFSVDGGTITWGGPLGGISEAGTIQSTQVTNQGFDIIIQNDTGGFQTIGCHR